jgi:DNA-binding CsgD family transcriptional regulator
LLVTVARRALLQGAVSSAIAALDSVRALLTDLPASEVMLGIEADEVLLEAFAQAGDARQLAPLAADLLGRLSAADADPRRAALVRLKAASTRPEDNPAAAAGHLAAAAEIAGRLHDDELAARTDAVGARNALAAGDATLAASLAERALATAEAAGLDGWAAEVAIESLEAAGRAHRLRDLTAARAAFERYRQIADDHEGLGIWRLRSRHELATLDMLSTGSSDQLLHVRELAADSGASCIGTVVNVQLANVWSLEQDLDKAVAAAAKCLRSARQIKAPRMEAIALCLQANVAAIRGDRQQCEAAAEQAEQVLPGDPGVLASTWGHARVLCALFRDDFSRAERADATAATYLADALAAGRGDSPPQAAMLSPWRVLGLHALIQAVSGRDVLAALDLARTAGADVSWNAGCLAYAEAVLEGRSGNEARASELAEEGAGHFAPFAPWWNNLARRLVAADALRDGWGQPSAWMREAASDFEASGHDQLASACRGVLRRAGERVPRRGRGVSEVPARMRQLGITSREMDVLLLVAGGHSNSAIAKKLFISPKTVETHVASLVSKMGQSGRRELVAHAARFAMS